MKIARLTLENFRGYREPKSINFDDFTVIIGKNDIGKSTLLEALCIFFGNQNPDKSDQNVEAAKVKEPIRLTVEFADLPIEFDLDAGAKTNLEAEYLINSKGYLEIRKEYTNLSKPSVCINAYHPSNSQLNDLHDLKIGELRTRIATLKVEGDFRKTVKNEIRKSIWAHFKDSLTFEDQLLEISKEGIKDIWEKISPQLPLFALFQSDRQNLDKDDEIQDPMKLATKEVLKTLQPELDKIRDQVNAKVTAIAENTIKKIQEMNSEVGSSLLPNIPEPNWDKVFNITLKGDDDIPLNKRGSGVRRLVLINFFREEAERKKREKSVPSVIYAIEEPETSQHPDWQVKLLKALEELSEGTNSQVVITTHSPSLASLIKLENIRYIKKLGNQNSIEKGTETNFSDIANSLGLLPQLNRSTDNVKAFLCVEGPTDVDFFTNISPIFGLDLSTDDRIAVLSLGGSTLGHWVTKNYLQKLKRPEIHIYDRDVTKYKTYVDEVNSRGEGCWATLTQKYEIENYIHPALINSEYRIEENFITFNEGWKEEWGNKNVPSELSTYLKNLKLQGNTQIRNEGSDAIKRIFSSRAASKMTKELFEDLGTYEEVNSWFDELKKRLN